MTGLNPTLSHQWGYPPSWGPRGAPVPDEELPPPEVEAYIGLLTPAELSLLLARAKGQRQGKIGAIASAFGPTIGSFPQIVPYANAEGFRLADAAIMCTAGDLVTDGPTVRSPRPEAPHQPVGTRHAHTAQHQRGP